MKKTLKQAKEKTGRLVDRLLPRSHSRPRSQSPALADLDLGPALPDPSPPGSKSETSTQPMYAAVAESTSLLPSSGNGSSPLPAAQDHAPILPTLVPASTTHGRADVVFPPTASMMSVLEVREVPAEAQEALQILEASQAVINNNSNITYNFGRDVMNNNSVTNYIQLAKDEPIMKEIKAVLGDRFVLEAAYETQPEGAGCMKGTRVHVLEMLMSWAKEDSTRIFWLAGLAGTGKTSIAVSLCQMLANEPKVLLAGTFFCSRTANIVGQTDIRCVLPTLAGTLAEQSPDFAAALAALLNADARAALKPIATQIDSLLQRPLEILSSETRPIIFVIDALDECSDETEVKALLQAISVLKCDATVKFILTSRPETHISTSPILSSDRNSILRLHTIDTGEVTEDIRLYIEDTFTKSPLAKPWCSEADVRTLATLSEGLFIFASTIVSYVLKASSVKGRTNRLQTALSAVQASKAALGPLDAVYEFVLTRVSDAAEVEPEELEATLQALTCILAARVPLSVGALADLLGSETEELRESLRRLHAVVHVPEDTDQPGVRTLHASFGDYLFSRRRIATSLGEETLAHGCLRVMREQLRFDISKSRSSYKPNPTIKPDSITLSLEYACMHWVYHVVAIADPGALDNEVDESLRPRLLFWLEVMSVLGRVSRAAAMLHIATSTVRLVALAQFLRDADGFVASSREAIERSAPHIYLSALPFAAKSSLVYQTFTPLFAGLISVETVGIDRHGGRLIMTLVGHKEAVNSIAYSSDGRLIVSGSEDGTARIWDMWSGEETMAPLDGGGPVKSVAIAFDGKTIAAGTDAGNVSIWNASSGKWTLRRLSGHSKGVNCVSFSPDGSLLASGAWDNTVRLWRAETGEQVSVMKGHTHDVNAVAFSPLGDILASGSHDNTVRLWHGVTGDPIGQPLRGHTDWVRSVSFHPDGLILASGSDDQDVRLWDIQNGKCIATLPGHSNLIMSVRFSPKGRYLASGACDNTVRLWTMQRDATEISSIVLEGHSSLVNSVTFSPDGLYISSASNDRTIRIWDVGSSRTTVQPLQAHSSAVNSVGVSANGEFIVSGCHDHSVCVWDTKSGKRRLSPLIEHTEKVCCVAISPDGLLIASASEDRTIQFWNAQTGANIGESQQEHENGVNALAFSSDGRWLASGSNGQTVRIWDIATRQTSNLGPLRCNGSVYTVVFSPDGLYVAAGDSSGRLYIWNVDTGQLEREPLSTNTESVWSIAFSPVGTRIVSVGDDLLGRVWDTSTGENILILEGHSGGIRSVVFSPNGQLIGTGSNDRTVRLWDAETGAQLAMLPRHDDWVMSVTFTPDGNSIISGSWDSTIRIWDVDAALLKSSNHDNDIVTALVSTKLKDGWLLGPSDELLLWVPVDYRRYIWASPCTTLIGRRRVVVSAADGPLYQGERWTESWGGLQSA